LYKRSQLFIRTYTETLSIAAMRVSNEDCPAFTIHGCDTDPRPACFAEIVSYDFPLRFTRPRFCLFAFRAAMTNGTLSRDEL